MQSRILGISGHFSARRPVTIADSKKSPTSRPGFKSPRKVGEGSRPYGHLRLPGLLDGVLDLDGELALLHADSQQRAVVDLAGDEGAGDARFQLVLEEA